MSLIYKFKKEKLDNGEYVYRPRILVILKGKEGSIEVPALVDSGCDTTVIPEGLAKAVGIPIKGKKTKLYAYREFSEVIISSTNITFVGKANRESVTLNIPILITLSKNDSEDEQDITLGVDGVFNYFDITFSKSKNRIILKRVGNMLRLKKNN